MSKKLKIAIIFGGRSGEHEVSIVSATSVLRALDPQKYAVTMIGIDKSGRWTLPNKDQLIEHKSVREFLLSQETQTVGLIPFAQEKQLMALPEGNSMPAAMPGHFDVMIPILHGTYGEDGTIQGLLELASVPYVGSGVLGSALGMDKEVSKRIFQAENIPVVPWLTIRKHEFSEKSKQTQIQIEVSERFGFPVFVKPANMGSSVGVHKIKNAQEFIEKVSDALSYDTKVLIEQAIEARELEVSILGNHQPKASVVGEIIPTHEFYSYEAKYLDENGAHLKIPAENISPAVVQKIQDLACRAFLCLECRGLARVDFFMDKKTGELYLNEINTIPGFTSISMYPKLWEASGIPYAKLLDQLIDLALQNYQEKTQLKTSIR